jgi:hypothetical protein
MLDKVVIKNKHEAIMVFTDRDPFYLYSDRDVMEIVQIMLEPMNVHRATPFVDNSQEDTVTSWPIAA